MHNGLLVENFRGLGGCSKLRNFCKFYINYDFKTRNTTFSLMVCKPVQDVKQTQVPFYNNSTQTNSLVLFKKFTLSNRENFFSNHYSGCRSFLNRKKRIVLHSDIFLYNSFWLNSYQKIDQDESYHILFFSLQPHYYFIYQQLEHKIFMIYRHRTKL